MSALLANIIYYQDHETLLRESLNEIVERTKPEPDDQPAFTFATLVEALGRHQDKTVTIAAMAIMRLGELERTEPTDEGVPVTELPEYNPEDERPERAS